MKQRITIQEKYLLVPISLTAIPTTVVIRIDGRTVYEFVAGLFTKADAGEPDFYAEIPVPSSWLAKTLEIDTGSETAETAFAGADEVIHEPDPFQPYVHLTPRRGWTNDPCGLCWYQGKYHVYYQHNMFGTEWNNMSWGHAVSEDLIHWEHKQEAILPTEDGAPFTGSALIAKDIKGVPDGALIMCYTQAGGMTPWSEGKKFRQHFVWSMDGDTFQDVPDAGVPYIIFQNRDPKVYRYEDAADSHWFMVLFLDGHEYGIFVSDDLKEWKMTQSLIVPESWECPDLVQLPVEGSDEKRWLFWTPNSFYMVGDFDGYRFTAHQEGQWFYGNSYLPYAAQTFANTGERSIQIPCLRADTTTFYKRNGMFGAPRTMTLVRDGEKYLLSQHLVSEVTDREVCRWKRRVEQDGLDARWDEDQAALIRMTIDDTVSFDMNICGSRIAWDTQQKKLAFSFVNDNDTQHVRDMTILVDRGVLEIMINHDTVVYYQRMGMEIRKEMHIEGSMDVQFSLIRR